MAEGRRAFEVGDQVEHKRLGKGEVTWVYRDGTLSVEFMGADVSVDVPEADLRSFERPVARCVACQREARGRALIGQRCGARRPNGSQCPGRLLSSDSAVLTSANEATEAPGGC
jgi:hypothetical protein